MDAAAPATYRFDDGYLSLRATAADNGSLQLRGEVKDPARYVRMELIAAAPMDRMTTYSGSGLPWPCPSFALTGTPNYYAIPATGNIITTFRYPNAYYTDDAITKVPPSIYARLYAPDQADPVILRMELPDQAPLRTLTHRPTRTGPDFYAWKDVLVELTTAEKTMYAMAKAKEQHGIA